MGVGEIWQYTYLVYIYHIFPIWCQIFIIVERSLVRPDCLYILYIYINLYKVINHHNLPTRITLFPTCNLYRTIFHLCLWLDWISESSESIFCDMLSHGTLPISFRAVAALYYLNWQQTPILRRPMRRVEKGQIAASSLPQSANTSPGGRRIVPLQIWHIDLFIYFKHLYRFQCNSLIYRQVNINHYMWILVRIKRIIVILKRFFVHRLRSLSRFAWKSRVGSL